LPPNCPTIWDHFRQAKYLFALGDSECAQINKSFQEAFNKHPCLSRYVVCAPLDLADARASRGGKRLKSQQDRWDEVVQKWTKQCATHGRSISFEFWGASKIVGLLQDTRPEIAGKLLYWFGAATLTIESLSKHVEREIKNLGPRYTPEFHVDLPIARVFDGLCCEHAFRDRIQQHRRAIYDATRNITSSMDRDTRLSSAQLHAKEAEEKARSVADALQMRDEVKPFIASADELVRLTADSLSKCQAALSELHNAGVSWHKETKKDSDTQSTQHADDPIEIARHRLWKLNNTLHSTEEFIRSKEFTSMETGALRVIGGPGTGKSHLFADVAKRRCAAGLPTVLVLGQHVSNGNLFTELKTVLDLPNQSTSYILGALDAAAEAVAGRALLLVDAINEGREEQLWKERFPGILEELKPFPRIALAVSCRSAFEDWCVPRSLTLTDIVRVEHRGFAGRMMEALTCYFDRQGLDRPSAPFLAPEFYTPLFLKTITTALKTQGLKSVPRGLRGIRQIMQFYGQALNQQIEKRVGRLTNNAVAETALHRVAQRMAKLGTECLPEKEAVQILDELCLREGHKLLRALIDEGALIDDVRPIGGNDDGIVDRQTAVAFAYQRFADHYMAERLIDKHLDKANPEASFAIGTPMGDMLRGQNYWQNAGIAEALAIQLPEVCQRELVALLDADGLEQWQLVGGFLESLLWRDPKAFSGETLHWLNRSPMFRHGHPIEETLLKLATEPNHPYNADCLRLNLMQRAMPDRDASWSRYLAESYANDDYEEGDTSCPASRIVEWAWHGDTRQVEPERMRLCAVALTWMLSTSHRRLRDRATKALARVFWVQPGLVSELLDTFAEVDDDYIRERLFAAVYGGLLNSREPHHVSAAARKVSEIVFARGFPPSNILLRDYSSGILELAAHLDVLPGDIDLARLRPPFEPSDPIEWIIEDETQALKDRRDSVSWSCFDHDFNWYTLNVVEQFTATPIGAVELDTDESRFRNFADFVNSTGDKSLIKAFSSIAPTSATDHGVSKFIRDELMKMLREQLAGDPNYDRAVSESADGNDLPLLEQYLSNDDQKSVDRAPAYLERLRKEQRFLDLLQTPERERYKTDAKPYINRFGSYSGSNPTPFLIDKNQAAAWICKRVYELGWTKEKFENFEKSHFFRFFDRDRPILERIGKKYQYIALHELLGKLSDRYLLLPYRWGGRDEARPCKGAWELSMRDIDPSLLFDGHDKGNQTSPKAGAWWIYFEADLKPTDPATLLEWLRGEDDIPDTRSLLRVRNPNDGRKWLVLWSQWTKQQPPDPEQNWSLGARRVRAHVHCCLVSKADAKKLLAHLQKPQDSKVINRSIPYGDLFDPDHGGQQWLLGELFWHDSTSNAFDGWTEPNFDEGRWNCPVATVMPVTRYFSENLGDISPRTGHSSISFAIPSRWFAASAGLVPVDGKSLEFADQGGRVRFIDPMIANGGQSAALVDEEWFGSFLNANKLSVVWNVGGDKEVYQPLHYGRQYFAGVHSWDGVTDIAGDQANELELFDKPRKLGW
jgi:hypothetical protein